MNGDEFCCEALAITDIQFEVSLQILVFGSGANGEQARRHLRCYACRYKGFESHSHGLVSVAAHCEARLVRVLSFPSFSPPPVARYPPRCLGFCPGFCPLAVTRPPQAPPTAQPRGGEGVLTSPPLRVIAWGCAYGVQVGSPTTATAVTSAVSFSRTLSLSVCRHRRLRFCPLLYPTPILTTCPKLATPISRTPN